MAHLPYHLQGNKHQSSPCNCSALRQTLGRTPKFSPWSGGRRHFHLDPHQHLRARPWVLHTHPSSAQAGTQRSQHQRNKIPFPFSHCTSGRNQHCQGELSYKPGETKRTLKKERICPWGKETLVYCRSFWIIFSSTSFFWPSLPWGKFV